MGSILVFGGTHDPNVHAVIDAAQKSGIDTIPLLIGNGQSPSLRWHLTSGDLWVDGNPLKPAAVFARQDAFHSAGPGAEYRAISWYAALQGWLATCPSIRVLNRTYLGRYTNKLHVLALARASGLRAPDTIVTNDPGYLTTSGQLSEMIAKPIPGGGYCAPLDEILTSTELRDGVAASPAIIQERLRGPDVRIYRISDRTVGFRIEGAAIDYRTSRDHQISVADSLPLATVQRLESLMTSMGLDWGAADFKEDPESGELTFLEINSNPMFSVFDRVAGGAIADAIVEFLKPC